MATKANRGDREKKNPEGCHTSQREEMTGW